MEDLQTEMPSQLQSVAHLQSASWAAILQFALGGGPVPHAVPRCACFPREQRPASGTLLPRLQLSLLQLRHEAAALELLSHSLRPNCVEGVQRVTILLCQGVRRSQRLAGFRQSRSPLRWAPHTLGHVRAGTV